MLRKCHPRCADSLILNMENKIMFKKRFLSHTLPSFSSLSREKNPIMPYEPQQRCYGKHHTNKSHSVSKRGRGAVE